MQQHQVQRRLLLLELALHLVLLLMDRCPGGLDVVSQPHRLCRLLPPLQHALAANAAAHAKAAAAKALLCLATSAPDVQRTLVEAPGLADVLMLELVPLRHTNDADGAAVCTAAVYRWACLAQLLEAAAARREVLPGSFTDRLVAELTAQQCIPYGMGLVLTLLRPLATFRAGLLALAPHRKVCNRQLGIARAAAGSHALWCLTAFTAADCTRRCCRRPWTAPWQSKLLWLALTKPMPHSMQSPALWHHRPGLASWQSCWRQLRRRSSSCGGRHVQRSRRRVTWRCGGRQLSPPTLVAAALAPARQQRSSRRRAAWRWRARWPLTCCSTRPCVS